MKLHTNIKLYAISILVNILTVSVLFGQGQNRRLYMNLIGLYGRPVVYKEDFFIRSNQLVLNQENVYGYSLEAIWPLSVLNKQFELGLGYSHSIWNYEINGISFNDHLHVIGNHYRVITGKSISIDSAGKNNAYLRIGTDIYSCIKTENKTYNYLVNSLNIDIGYYLKLSGIRYGIGMLFYAYPLRVGYSSLVLKSSIQNNFQVYSPLIYYAVNLSIGYTLKYGKP